MSKVTLGEILREKLLKNAQELERQKILEAEALALEKSKHGAVLQTFFEAAQAQFTKEIISGQDVTPVIIGERGNYEIANILKSATPGYELSSTRHKLNHVYELFTKWAHDAGLKAAWGCDIDFRGKTLTVVPL